MSWHGDVVEFAHERDATVFHRVGDGAGKWRDEAKVVEDVFGEDVVGMNDWDVALVGVVEDGLADEEELLIMDDVGLEIVDDATDFTLGSDADAEAVVDVEARDAEADELSALWEGGGLTVIEREVVGGETGDAITAVDFFVADVVLAGSDDENVVATLGHTAGEVATEGRDAVHSGPIKV